MTITDKNNCTGCGLCESVCPVNAIKMAREENGFYYPVITEACLECEKCRHECIVENSLIEACDILDAYSFSLKDHNLETCASGGVAFALGKYVLDEGGVVYGVGYSKDYKKSIYIRADSIDKLEKLKDTKYIHASNSAYLFSSIKSDLQEGKEVLFCGLPCEVAALKKLYHEHSEQLLLVDIICHGVTSELVQERKIDQIQEKFNGDSIEYFSVKNKRDGWKQNSILFASNKECEFAEKFYDSDFGYAFSHYSRKSCYSCQFKGNNRSSDITIGDYWGVNADATDYNEKGVSVVIIRTPKGKALFDHISDYNNVQRHSLEEITANNKWYYDSIPLGDRDLYEKNLLSNKGIYVPHSIKIKRKLKKLLRI